MPFYPLFYVHNLNFNFFQKESNFSIKKKNKVQFFTMSYFLYEKNP